MKTVICVMAAAAMLAGCGAPMAQKSSSTRATASGPDTCNATAYQNLIGQDAVVDLSLPEPKRTYRLDQPVTTDFNPARLNIKLDETDTIIAIDCG
ncbi:Inhibitor I78 domain containing protein [Sulfitobacter noctilucicola]|uniref:Putative lipoprotein YajG n=1 Tax=Sulfitobacter noctilucicola TaxID=1342301 RepID=A0A7W6Q2B7_9RHOB|nr:I78 family peptidase inhibitor [Sulfitobacter noctilucicola]KIN63085.1 Inhibitor I78 domain containing protein [Sulfitobacter noctilucicola]MBB4172388.1 putative lipoprotein YajG [Sulfitobacter noctilucicola]